MSGGPMQQYLNRKVMHLMTAQVFSLCYSTLPHTVMYVAHMVHANNLQFCFLRYFFLQLFK